MRNFKWSEDNEVFLPQVDAEHRDLFRIAEELQQAVAAQATAEVKGRLDALAAHVEDHFSHEEWLMQSVRYPSYAWHKQQHNTARKRLALLAPIVATGEAEAAEILLGFFEGWLHDHTTLTDRMMAAYVRNYERANGAGALAQWGTPCAAPASTGRAAEAVRRR